ncbi:MAG TPA: HlyD family efflux transporter periplasmic adaptor subunit [Mucilaginibacter sp.]|jgi:HlyD family secretion protein|nr:HlyD family efflux transporter periplasmic adaptor subunit [Mucilaginibacter sp.]
MPSQNDNENQHSYDLQEVIGKTPSWLVRSGSLLIFSIIVIIVVFSATIKFPESIHVQLKIKALNAGAFVSCTDKCLLDSVLIYQNQIVRKGQPLAILNHYSDCYSILRTLKTLDLDAENKKRPITLTDPKDLKLGLFQSQYEQIYAGYLLGKQRENIRKGGVTERLNFDSLKSLSKSVIKELEKVEPVNVLLSPISGHVYFCDILKKGMNLKPSQRIFYVMPNNNEFYGQINITTSELAKVREGQCVNVRIENYETLKGKLDFVSKMPASSGFYVAEVTFPADNIARIRAKSRLTDGIVVEAEIVTGKLTLLNKIGLKY